MKKFIAICLCSALGLSGLITNGVLCNQTLQLTDEANISQSSKTQSKSQNNDTETKQAKQTDEKNQTTQTTEKDETSQASNSSETKSNSNNKLNATNNINGAQETITANDIYPTPHDCPNGICYNGTAGAMTNNFANGIGMNNVGVYGGTGINNGYGINGANFGLNGYQNGINNATSNLNTYNMPTYTPTRSNVNTYDTKVETTRNTNLNTYKSDSKPSHSSSTNASSTITFKDANQTSNQNSNTSNNDSVNQNSTNNNSINNSSDENKQNSSMITNNKENDQNYSNLNNSKSNYNVNNLSNTNLTRNQNISENLAQTGEETTTNSATIQKLNQLSFQIKNYINGVNNEYNLSTIDASVNTNVNSIIEKLNNTTFNKDELSKMQKNRLLRLSDSLTRLTNKYNYALNAQTNNTSYGLTFEADWTNPVITITDYENEKIIIMNDISQVLEKINNIVDEFTTSENNTNESTQNNVSNQSYNNSTTNNNASNRVANTNYQNKTLSNNDINKNQLNKTTDTNLLSVLKPTKPIIENKITEKGKPKIQNGDDVTFLDNDNDKSTVNKHGYEPNIEGSDKIDTDYHKISTKNNANLATKTFNQSDKIKIYNSHNPNNNPNNNANNNVTSKTASNA